MVYHAKDAIGTTSSTRSALRSARSTATADQSLPGFRAYEGGPSGTKKVLDLSSPETASRPEINADAGAATSLRSNEKTKK